MLPQRLRETRTYQRVKAFTHKYEHLLMPSMLLGGTALDALQFRFLSLASTFGFVGAYGLICVGAIMFMVAPEHAESRVLRYGKLAAPFLQQFTIGALLSTSLLFYWFNGAFSVSWPIIALIAFFMIGNEVFRHIVTKPIVMLGMLYFALFALAATLSAYTLNSVDPFAFVAGGIASLIVMAGVLVVVLRVGQLKHQQKPMWTVVVIIFALMNAAYFLNIIPPIPLSLRDAGIYYTVTRTGDTYVRTAQEESFPQSLIPGITMTVTPGQPLSAYTAIAAPAALSTVMVHAWEYYDDTTHTWITSDRLSFSVHGGRAEGYRGYSTKSHLTEGRWRVSVETTRGQVLGRIPFTVRFASE